MTTPDHRSRVLELRPRVRAIKLDQAPDTTFYVRALTGRERLQLAARAKDHTARGTVLTDAEVASLGLCDENGNRLFTDSEADLAALEELDGGAVTAIALEVFKTAGLAAGALEAAEKN